MTKHLSLIIAALALTIPAVQAKVYDITLTNADKYTQCQLRYKGSSTTKFSGTDKKGQVVTMEVPTGSILLMKEVEEEKPEKPEGEKPEPEPKKDGDATPDAGSEDAKPAEGDGEKPAEAEEGKPAEGDGQAKDGEAKPATDTPPPADTGAADNTFADQVQNASVMLRTKLDNIDEEMKGVAKPSSSLLRQAESTKTTVGRSIEELDKLALAICETQQEYNEACMGAYSFSIVTKEQRDQYVRDGKAAYKAMVVDMKEKPNARKVGGLDKFEIMRDRYQGIPEYKEAHAWYLRTMKSLEKRWGKAIEKEEARRKSLQAAKKTAMRESDQKAFDKLSNDLREEGEDIDKVWYNPAKRNLRMLNHSFNRVTDTLRRNEESKLDPAVGTVPALLEEFWTMMDNAVELMVVGKVEEAEKLLDEDETYRRIVQLKATIFPNDYRDPIKEQRKALEQELKKRARSHRDLQRKLERQASLLERAVGNAESRIGALMESIQREKGDDAGENTVDMDESMKEDEADDAAAE